MIKKRYLILILFICLFTISAVSAEKIGNETNNPIAIDDNTPINEPIGEQANVSCQIVSENNNGKLSANEGTYSELIEKTGFGRNITSDNKFNSAEGSVTIPVKEKEPEIIIEAPEVTKYYYGTERFVVTLKENNKPISNAEVRIIIHGFLGYIETTDYSGQTSIGLYLNSGVYNITVAYNDIEVVSKVTILPTIHADDVVKVYRNDTQFYATFTDSNGIYLPKGTDVTFNYNGIFYSKEIIDNNGTAMLEINDGPGTYILTSSNPVTGEKLVNTVVVLSNIVENYDLVKYYNETKKFSVRVIAPNGEYASRQVVKFIFGNNIYETLSNSKGYAFLDAFLDPVLQPGEYVVNTSVRGNNVSNIIKILPTLSNDEMEVSPIDIKEGENEVIKVVLPNDATGKVSTIINNKEYSANVNNGVGNIIISDLTYGNYNIEVLYSGDSQYNSVKGNTSFIVNKTFSLIVPDVTKYYKGAERFVVSLVNVDNNNPLVNAQVKITINGQTYTKTTGSSGQTSLAINLESGVYNVTTEYDGMAVYSTVTVKPTIIADDLTKMYKNGTQYYATFVDTHGNPLPKGTEVTFNINGVMYTRKTNEMGIAKLNINLDPLTYIITAINPVNGEAHSNLVTVLPKIINNKDLTKYYKNASQYVVTLLGDGGKVVGAGETVTFNINGVFYTRTTNALGQAKLNINLDPGTYIITADYKGSKASNTVTVKSVLFANNLNMKYRDGSRFEAKVLDGQGKPLSGATVRFNINGVFYYRVTDSDGIAILNINLLGGEYIITSSYNGLNIANIVKIAPNPIYATIGYGKLDGYLGHGFTWQWDELLQTYTKDIYDQNFNWGIERSTVGPSGEVYYVFNVHTCKIALLDGNGGLIKYDNSMFPAYSTLKGNLHPEYGINFYSYGMYGVPEIDITDEYENWGAIFEYETVGNVKYISYDSSTFYTTHYSNNGDVLLHWIDDRS